MIKQRAKSLRENPRLPLIALMSTTAVGAILRAFHLGFKPLWYDEALLFWIGQRGLPALIAQNALESSAPPLFATLVSLVSRLSITEVALRIIPWLAGTLTIPAMYIVARRYLSVGGALASAIIIAVAPSQIIYSQQVREYSLSVLLGLLILIAFGNLLEKRTWRTTVPLIIATVIGIFTHYGLALLILATNLVFLGHLLSVKDRQRDLFLKWVVVQAFGVGAAMAVYSLALRQQFGAVVFGGAGYLQSGYWTGSSFGSAVQFVYSGVRDVMALTYPGYTFTLMLYAGSMVLALLHWRTLYPYLIAAPIAVLVAASLLGLYPLVNGRQDLFLTPLIILVAAATFDYLSRIESRRLLYALFLTLMAWRAIPILSSYYQTDGEGAVGKLVERVASEALPGDPIYVCLGGDPTIRYYINVRYPMPHNPLIEGIRGPGPRDYLDQVDSMLATYHRAWMITFRSCGDVTPLIDHIAREYRVELLEKRYPEAQLFFVH